MIGGEFEIDLSLQKQPSPFPPNTYLYSSGRAALYQVFRSAQSVQRKIWFPDYLCNTMVDAAVKAGCDYAFYELDEKFQVSVGALEHSGFSDGNIVVLVNYFGLMDLCGSAKLIKDSYPNAVVVEDDVQAYYSFAEKTNPYSDYRLTSYRKTFAVPDGAPVYTLHAMPAVLNPNTFAPYKIEGGVKKMNRDSLGIDDSEYLALFEEGSRLIDDNYDSVMSDDSRKLLAGTDFNQVKKQRRTNAQYLLNGLRQLGIRTLLPIPDDCVPLFIPIWLDNRNDVRKRMFANEIYCPVHWPLDGLDVKKGKEMAEHELSLIVDQRYDKNDIVLIINLLK